MTVSTHQTPRSQSLVASNLALLLGGGLALLIISLSLIHISEPTRLRRKSRMPSSA